MHVAGAARRDDDRRQTEPFGAIGHLERSARRVGVVGVEHHDVAGGPHAEGSPVEARRVHRGGRLERVEARRAHPLLAAVAHREEMRRVAVVGDGAGGGQDELAQLGGGHRPPPSVTMP